MTTERTWKIRPSRFDVVLADATYGRFIPAGANPTLLAWFIVRNDELIEGPFDNRQQALNSMVFLACQDSGS